MSPCPVGTAETPEDHRKVGISVDSLCGTLWVGRTCFVSRDRVLQVGDLRGPSLHDNMRPASLGFLSWKTLGPCEEMM